ncbi:MAG: tyrosine-type recombinase/integrase [Capsulimonadaceae bacterium]|nr:tyrosine-type recombinase/integrase [Capsulimonadaceae bacterium]
MSKLIWFCKSEEYETCGQAELKAFQRYLVRGSDSGAPKWGAANRNVRNSAIRPGTVKTYHSHVAAFFRYLVDQNVLDVSPMKNISDPGWGADEIQPFSDDQVRMLITAAKNSAKPARNVAIVTLMLDTGIREAELASLKIRDANLNEYDIRVHGKGDKFRIVPIGRTCRRALRAYLFDRGEDLDPEAALFEAQRGLNSGGHLTCSGVYQMVRDLGEKARVKGVRCSPHTFRHTFAINFLRGGGNELSLQKILGHTKSSMTAKYVLLARADIRVQHRKASPADRLLGPKS